MELLFLCIKIFFVRILDVSLGTLRTMITIKGKRLTASCVGFFEILIWFLVVKEALNTEETSIWIAISYSAGFAIGTYLGSYLSSKFINGNISVQVITDHISLASIIRDAGYGVTEIKVEGKNKDIEKDMLLIQINNKSFGELEKIITEYDKHAFIVVNETKYVENGFMGIVK